VSPPTRWFVLGPGTPDSTTEIAFPDTWPAPKTAREGISVAGADFRILAGLPGTEPILLVTYGKMSFVVTRGDGPGMDSTGEPSLKEKFDIAVGIGVDQTQARRTRDLLRPLSLVALPSPGIPGFAAEDNIRRPSLPVFALDFSKNSRGKLRIE
jgi:hypothetical protein